MVAPVRILVVDDDAEVRELLQDYLGGHAYQVETACDSGSMRAALAAGLPDLVLLDVGLPGEDGLSLARYLREHHDLPVIMVSGAGSAVDRTIGLEVGADDYVAKPFDPRELLARIKTVLRRYQRAPASAAVAEAVAPSNPIPACNWAPAAWTWSAASCSTPRARKFPSRPWSSTCSRPSPSGPTGRCPATSCSTSPRTATGTPSTAPSTSASPACAASSRPTPTNPR